MQNEKPDSSLDRFSSLFFSRLPEPIRRKTDTLTAQQKINILLAVAGAAGFMLLWLLFSFLFGQQTGYLDQQAFSSSSASTAALNTPTAITTEQTAFPQDPANTTPSADADELPEIKPVAKLTPAQKEEIERLRDNVHNEYQNVLSFRLTESRMIIFAQAASRIDKINMRWDTLIGAAPSDKIALEHLASAQMEIKQLLDNTKGMSLKDYQEIYDLSSRDNKFNTIANAYKNLVAQGIWGPVSPLMLGTPLLPQTSHPHDALRFPTLPPAAQTQIQPDQPHNRPQAPVNPAVAPAGSDTLPKSAD